MSSKRELDFAVRVQRMRVALALTQQEFATRIGVAASSVYRWEAGESEPSRMAVRAIRREFPDQFPMLAGRP